MKEDIYENIPQLPRGSSNIIHAASSFYISANKMVLFVFDEELSMTKKLNEICSYVIK